ncbi:MAG: hypothetical protein JXR89_08115, partial [Deltaproteobacteria bacterium]|nr:hypothetical protein [Deltaproteobacteria bacterium]
MEKFMEKLWREIVHLAVLAFCAGLAAAFLVPAAARAADQVDFNNLSPAQERQLMFPYLVSADDYREGKVEQRSFNLNQMLRGDEKPAKEASAYEKRLRRLEQSLAAGRTPAARRHKVGMLFAAGGFPPAWGEALLRVAPQVMAARGFVYLAPQTLEAVLSGFRYRRQLADPRALAAFLGEYPGSRYLLFLEGATVNQARPGLVEMRF